MLGRRWAIEGSTGRLALALALTHSFSSLCRRPCLSPRVVPVHTPTIHRARHAMLPQARSKRFRLSLLFRRSTTLACILSARRA